MRNNPESHAGTYGWAGLAAGVVAFDYFAPETLSHAVDRVLENPHTKYIAYALGAVVVGHLYNLIPDEIDPIAKLAEAVNSLGDTL